ncbi:uncharacterized protein LOC142612203 [Castanea sativa]|uniref:uncharacterized protein LOC142612203 n=1 Tax=Castanea sativa TaxID=21020 RepID=UPI003F64D3E6
MNSQLSQEFMEWEVQAALKQMPPLKAPSPDGLAGVNAKKFCKFWSPMKSSQVSAPVRPRVRWSPPPDEFYKINFDAAVFHEDNIAGIGMIVRDSSGLVMASLSHNIPFQNSVEELESLAACRALEFALELGLDKAILEGDSLTALKDDSASLASFGLLVRDAQSLAGLFNCICFLHVGRDGNSIAHNLARHARHVTSFSI